MKTSAAEAGPDVVAFFASEMPASAWFDQELAQAQTPDEAYIVRRRRALGRKFIIDDLEADPRLVAIAKAWLPSQKGASFDFLDNIARKYEMFGQLTIAQWKGVLNCLARSLARDDRGPGTP